MNLQQVSGATLLAAKTRMTALGQTFRAASLAIEQRNAEHDRHRQAALRENMRPAEFLALFPNPPGSVEFAAEDAEIATKQAQIASLNAGGGTNTAVSARLQNDIDMLNVQKGLKTQAYTRQLTKPERSLTDAEFATLYPAPTHTADQATISAGQTEANKLDAFLKSGPYPNSGTFDVDLLAETAVAYP
ncbi:MULTISPECIES: hypothetical protein [Methylomonas]|uniref:Uncharacterized protein n=1 Tax=Methylomonas koyamae TaxID=702114 RepID=A0A177P476_9GAMM|nr:hypothetical protein [Methylomonas koyamae]OAI25076.1 hypothetical protein A1355_20105 [Methylomonas koyamae]